LSLSGNPSGRRTALCRFDPIGKVDWKRNAEGKKPKVGRCSDARRASLSRLLRYFEERFLHIAGLTKA
jgi:hypothetical protein